jgi:uncharacterized membrane protein
MGRTRHLSATLLLASSALGRDQVRIEDAKAHLLRSLCLLGLLSVLPAALIVGFVYWRFGREVHVDYDREYEQEPPGDLEPALVTTLLHQGGQVDSLDFTATLFDLIRRGVYKATPVSTVRPVWSGLRHDEVADLEISRGKHRKVSSFEQPVVDVVDPVIGGGSKRLSEFREAMERDPVALRRHFADFKTRVQVEAYRRGWFRSIGPKALSYASAAFWVVGVVCTYVAMSGWRPQSPRWIDVVLIGVVIAAFFNAVILLVAVLDRRIWTQRTRVAQEQALRWMAFRRYLNDFPRLDEAPVAALVLWERYLVYAIGFGTADRVLHAAHLHLPEQVMADSSIVWISPVPGSALGSGASAMAISDLASGFGAALGPTDRRSR